MKDQVLKQIKENLQDSKRTIELINDILPVIEKMAHHKKITKKLVDEINLTGHRAHIYEGKLYIRHKDQETTYYNLTFKADYCTSFSPVALIKHLKEDFHVNNLKHDEEKLANYEKDRQALIDLKGHISRLDIVAFSTHRILWEIDNRLEGR